MLLALSTIARDTNPLVSSSFISFFPLCTFGIVWNGVGSIERYPTCLSNNQAFGTKEKEPDGNGIGEESAGMA